MAEHEQVRPLAPATERPSSDEEEATVKKPRNRKCLKCCGCIIALFLIIAIVIVILIFTVFRVKDPVIRLNNFTVTHLELMNNSNIPKPGTNISVIADVSVKNPNIASFKYSNTTTTLFYYGTLAGEARGPPGKAKARRTTRMNVSVDMITDRLMSNPNLSVEVGSGVLSLTSYSRVPGRIKILKIIRRHVTVKMNCSVTFNISSLAIQSTKCKRKVDL